MKLEVSVFEIPGNQNLEGPKGYKGVIKCITWTFIGGRERIS